MYIFLIATFDNVTGDFKGFLTDNFDNKIRAFTNENSANISLGRAKYYLTNNNQTGIVIRKYVEPDAKIMTNYG